MTFKRFVLIVVLVIGLVFGAKYCLGNVGSGMVGQGDPVKVVKAAINAQETVKVDKVTRYFTPVPGRSMTAMLNAKFTNFEKIEVQNLKATLILKEGVAAQVQVTWDELLTHAGYTEPAHCAAVVKLVQIDGKWWINEAFQ